MARKSAVDFRRTLDARPDRLDLRDREFVPLVESLPPSFPDDAQIRSLLPAYVKAGLILDQGREGACTGFGLACVANYLFWRWGLKNGTTEAMKPVSPRMLYHLARFYDEWAGEDYEGSSCRGAMKAWHKHGVCMDTLWPYRDGSGKVAFVPPSEGWELDAAKRRIGVYYRVNRASVVDIQAAILQVGAVYVSAEVHDGWGLPAMRGAVKGHGSLPVIGPLRRASSIGGHAFALVGYNPTGFVVQNSWGLSWGNSGFAVLPYEQWVKHGTDAWVCALGVPAAAKDVSSVVVRGGRKVVVARAGGVAFTSRAVSERPAVSARVRPWGDAEAYRHSIVLGNDGRVISRIITHESAAAGVAELAAKAPAAWFGRKRGTNRLVLYAHGGLNSEDASIDRIRVLAPYFEVNGIYPLFVTWKTGPIETLSDILEDELKRVPRPEGDIGDFLGRVKEAASEVLDRTIELASGPVVKPIWGQMKQNAAASAEDGRGCSLLADALATLASKTDFELHLVGHSAGSILLGHLLDLLPGRGLTVSSCSLYAPACSVRFALDHYGPAAKSGTLSLRNLHMHVLSDERERGDTVGPYRKSLLYLVSRALESSHKMPLLGMATVFKGKGEWNRDEEPAIGDWRRFWGSRAGNLHVLDAAQVSTGSKGRLIKSAHGCFDNDAGTITATLRRILGEQPKHEVQSLDY